MAGERCVLIVGSDYFLKENIFSWQNLYLKLSCWLHESFSLILLRAIYLVYPSKFQIARLCAFRSASLPHCITSVISVPFRLIDLNHRNQFSFFFPKLGLLLYLLLCVYLLSILQHIHFINSQSA